MDKIRYIQNLGLIGLALIILIAFGLQTVTEIQYKQNYPIYRGYIIADDNLQGFFGCEDQAPLGFSESNNSGIANAYQEHKQGINSPVYMEIRGKTIDTPNQQWNFSGLPWKQSLEISELVKVVDASPLDCKNKYIQIAQSWHRSESEHIQSDKDSQN